MTRKLCLLLFAVLYAGAASADTISICVDCPTGSSIGLPVGIGHAFIQMTPMGGPAAGQTSTVGFYPKNTTPYGAGIVKNDAAHAKDFCITYNVTVAQYNAAVAVVNARIASPGTYNVLTNNCVDFASAVATAAGITLPNTVNGVNVSDPASVWKSLDMIGNGGVSGGGTVMTAAGGDTTTPKDYSYVGITNDGHDNPSQLASNSGSQFDVTNLGLLNANNLAGLSFNFSNADLNNSIVSVDWGDGSPFSNQQSSFSHVYSSPGPFNGDLFVFDAGSVQSWEFTANVSSSPGAEVSLNVKSFSPSLIENIGFDPATSLALSAAVPEASGLLFVALGLATAAGSRSLVYLLRRRD